MVEFMYHGEVNVAQDNIPLFLTLVKMMGESKESVQREECKLTYRKDCQTVNDVFKQYHTEESCANVPRTITETIHEEECNNNNNLSEEKVVTHTEAVCEVVTETECKTVQDQVYREEDAAADLSLIHI